MATVWNPADKTSNLNLSNTNHTASTVAGPAGNEGVRAFGTSHSAGKWYLEFNTIADPYNLALGFGNSGDTLGATPGSAPYLDTGGTAHEPGNASSSNPGWGGPQGHVVGVAIDIGGGKVWWQYDGGNWNNDILANQNPVLGVGGFALGTMTTPIVPMVYLQFGNDNVTLNAGDSAFTYSVPSGFTAWDSPVVFPYSFGRIIS